jgi:hypothetical protein
LIYIDNCLNPSQPPNPQIMSYGCAVADLLICGAEGGLPLGTHAIINSPFGLRMSLSKKSSLNRSCVQQGMIFSDFLNLVIF